MHAGVQKPLTNSAAAFHKVFDSTNLGNFSPSLLVSTCTSLGVLYVATLEERNYFLHTNLQVKYVSGSEVCLSSKGTVRVFGRGVGHKYHVLYHIIRKAFMSDTLQIVSSGCEQICLL